MLAFVDRQLGPSTHFPPGSSLSCAHFAFIPRGAYRPACFHAAFEYSRRVSGTASCTVHAVRFAAVFPRSRAASINLRPRKIARRQFELTSAVAAVRRRSGSDLRRNFASRNVHKNQLWSARPADGSNTVPPPRRFQLVTGSQVADDECVLLATCIQLVFRVRSAAQLLRSEFCLRFP